MHTVIPITVCWFDRHSLVITGRYCANSAGFSIYLLFTRRNNIDGKKFYADQVPG
ncbi:MAG: hypothetical protein INR73_09430 [Williamsia sp.]|nr:hypothetical protein [Williamsia sp.]